MHDPPETRAATIAVYDRPPWWRTRKFWRVALPVLAGVGSLAIWYALLA